MPTASELAEELNLVAEYARLALEFEVKEGPQPHQGVVAVSGEEFLVNLAWAMGNTKRLPDRATSGQMMAAIRLSHPDVKGIGPKR